MDKLGKCVIAYHKCVFDVFQVCDESPIEELEKTLNSITSLKRK